MMRTVFLRAGAALLLATSLTAAACDDSDDDDDIGVPNDNATITAITGDDNDGTPTRSATMPSENGSTPSASDDEDVEPYLKDFCSSAADLRENVADSLDDPDALKSAFEDFRDDIDDIDAPDAYKDWNDQVVDSVDTTIDSIEDGNIPSNLTLPAPPADLSRAAEDVDECAEIAFA